jgi:hypothetical protein
MLILSSFKDLPFFYFILSSALPSEQYSDWQIRTFFIPCATAGVSSVMIGDMVKIARP